MTERLTQLATGLGRSVNDHANIKTQLEHISEEQQTKTHQQTPYTLIDSAADLSYVSEDTIVQRSMGEILTTTQGDMQLTSGDGHSHVSSESMTTVADGSVSMTNAKDNIILSAHTGKLEATAKQDVNIASSTQAVEVVANDKITLSAGGASIVLEGTNITISANQFTEKVGKHSKAGGGMDGRELNSLPQAYHVRFHFVDDQNIPYSHTSYTASYENGQQITGITDENGYTESLYSSEEQQVSVHLDI